MSTEIKRINLGQSSPNSPIELPLLTGMQHESFRYFIDKGIEESVKEILPVKDYNEDSFELTIHDITFDEPELSPDEAMRKGVSYSIAARAKATLKDLEEGFEETQEVFLGDVPYMTDRGTFIINGNERIVVSQLTRSPGAFFEGEFEPRIGKQAYTAAIRPDRGAWIEFEIDRKDVMWVRINRGRKIAVTSFLKAFNIPTKSIIEVFAELDNELGGELAREIYNTTVEEQDPENQTEALLDIYSKMRPGDPRIIENAQEYFNETFTDQKRFSLGEVGRYKMNRRLGLEGVVDPSEVLLQQKDLLAVVRELVRLYITQEPGDDIDHLGNRRIRLVGEVIQQSFRIGLRRLEKLIRERLSTGRVPGKPLSPTTLVNARVIMAAVNEFFGSSQLSQFLQQTNPLAELEHLRTITATGPGGLTRERAGAPVRDVKPSHYGKIDAIMTPEGPNIGLNLHFSMYSRVNEFGFLEAAYRRVEQTDKGSFITDEIVYMDAIDEEKFRIAEATVTTDDKGKIIEERVPVRYNGTFVSINPKMIDFVDAHPSVMVGTSAATVPFLASDVGARALIASNMSKQAVPLVSPTPSRVGTGVEKNIISNSGRSIMAKNKGEVLYADGSKIIVNTGDGVDEYHLTKFMRTNSNTCFNQTVRVKVGDKVKRGDVLVDGPSHVAGEMALGRDLLLAFVPIDGYAYEDSVLLSEEVLKKDLLTSIHIKEYDVQVMDTKLGPEEITRDIPNVSEDVLRNLDDDGLVIMGAEVGPGDILVGKIAPKGVTELTPEERLLRAVFGEKSREVRDTSLRVSHGDSGKVIGIHRLSKDKGDKLGPGVMEVIKVKVAHMSKIGVGDKVAGKHASKGVIARVFPEEDMPYMEDGTPVQMCVNPISILQRMNMGQILEAHLGWAAHHLDKYYAVPAFDKIALDVLQNLLKEAGVDTSGKVTLYDGRTGEPLENAVAVGYAQIMKLHHLVKDKMHARSTGPYSLVTQQPLGGKSQMGGQRLGEMEVWALEAHGAAHMLQEMLTIKSDDVRGRSKAFEAIIKGIPIPEARLPEAFKLLVKELNALGLEVEAIRNRDDGTQEVIDTSQFDEL
ncbi:DNA-directed RNA polymerase subunit beta [candidate division WWE3 bacterium]|uniref:DNA-directed RNA polymerase subunit beta n=1 Tax=candidate division WWE3 bacterium TaxID=2053526 RepID=A0A955LW16_UNCKA|nr:DNA-directed RNA polymerase subunit beta [candidate division WWE3 bacterium]